MCASSMSISISKVVSFFAILVFNFDGGSRLLSQHLIERHQLNNNNQSNICKLNKCHVIPYDWNNNQPDSLDQNQLNECGNNNQWDFCDLNFDQLSLNDVKKKEPRRDQNVGQSKLQDVLKTILSLTEGQKFVIFCHLTRRINEEADIHRQYFGTANNLSKIKNLLLMKKELAISALLLHLPFLSPENHEAKMAYLRIMPVLFSHVSLYDVSVDEIFQIVDLLRLHPAFTAQEGLFAQWFAMFDARRKSKRQFSFKDENYVRDLPSLPYSFSHDRLTRSIGYSDIALLRAFHRWLRLHRLHKYLYFFASLSYEEILDLDDNNFEFYQEHVNLHVITVGAKHKILREVELLRERRKCLLSILKMPFHCQQTVEVSLRDIKRILRTPICFQDIRNEKLPELILEVMSKVFHFVVGQPSVNEKMVSLLGLLISLCKEAWNYNVFKPEEKECFNNWRHQLMEKTGQTRASSNSSYSAGKQVTIFMDNSNLREQTAGNSYYQCLEEVANNCADFILK